MSYTLDDWTTTENGSGAVDRSSINNGGSYSADLYTPAGAGNTVSILQSVSLAVGTNVKLSLDVRCDTAARTIVIYSADPTGGVGTLFETYSIVAKDTWYTKTYDFIWTADDNAVFIGTNSNGHFYIDNVKLEPYYT